MDLEYIFQEIDIKNLSQESAEKTEELLNFISHKIRQEYDIAKKLVLNKEAVNMLLETKEIKTEKELIQRIMDGKITIMSTEIKKRFNHLIDVAA